MPTPKDTKLYAEVKKAADTKFLAPTSIYKSAWIVAEYKRRGGLYREDGQKRGLTQWFREDWVDLRRPVKDARGRVVGYEKCGRPEASASGTYPLCRPSHRVAKDTPKTVAEIDKKKVATLARKKQRVKFSDRVTFI